jgi:hypothetical protein
MLSVCCGDIVSGLATDELLLLDDVVIGNLLLALEGSALPDELLLFEPFCVSLAFITTPIFHKLNYTLGVTIALHMIVVKALLC